MMKLSFLLIFLINILTLLGCKNTSVEPVPDPIVGTVSKDAISSEHVGDMYPLDIYLPPGYDDSQQTLSVIYALDSEIRFETLISVLEELELKVMMVGIGNIEQRNRDYIPPNSCNPGGGGHINFYNFITLELIPFIDSKYKSDKETRTLIGHSLGGAFTVYALFTDQPNRRFFTGFVSSDASIVCAPEFFNDLEQKFSDTTNDLQVKLHISATAQGNAASVFPLANKLASRGYAGLSMMTSEFHGTHNGIVRPSYKEGIQHVYSYKSGN